MVLQIVGIIDYNGGFINTDGFSLREIEDLLATKKDLIEKPNFIDFETISEKIWSVGAEIFIPAAGSRMVEKNQLDTMIANGLEVVSCGANVPFNDTEIFMGNILSEVDKKIAVIPDFIANCGMARVFAFLMENEGEITDEILFKDASNVIKDALQKTFKVCPKGINLTEKSLDIAIKQLQNRK